MRMKNIKTLLVILLGIIAACPTFAQKNDSDRKRRFEVGITQNLLLSSNSLFNYAGGFLGYEFINNNKIIAEFDFGKQLIGGNNNCQLIALSYAHEFHNKDNLSFQVSIGPGLLRVKDENQAITLQPVALFGIQPRIYFSPRSFVGFDAKAFIGKQFSMGSFIGFNWGIRF